VVATPIGNLEDFSPRAVNILKAVDLIAAEDTRHSRPLLRHFGIKTPLMAMHEHNEREAMHDILKRLQDNHSIALISDAGTPLISTRGFRWYESAISRASVSPPYLAPAPLSAPSQPQVYLLTASCSRGSCPAPNPPAVSGYSA